MHFELLSFGICSFMSGQEWLILHTRPISSCFVVLQIWCAIKEKGTQARTFFYGSCILKHHKTAAEATAPECLLCFRICVLDFLPALSSLHCKNVIFLCPSGSTFKPLNSVKRLDKSKKRNRRTTIMGIPNQVQKELGMSKHHPKAIDIMCPSW